jgi:hypothetical protein
VGGIGDAEGSIPYTCLEKHSFDLNMCNLALKYFNWLRVTVRNHCYRLRLTWQVG